MGRLTRVEKPAPTWKGEVDVNGVELGLEEAGHDEFVVAPDESIAEVVEPLVLLFEEGQLAGDSGLAPRLVNGLAPLHGHGQPGDNDLAAVALFVVLAFPDQFRPQRGEGVRVLRAEATPRRVLGHWRWFLSQSVRVCWTLAVVFKDLDAVFRIIG